jgi:hypothetical protein
MGDSKNALAIGRLTRGEFREHQLSVLGNQARLISGAP